MKFRITKLNFDLIQDLFDKKDKNSWQEIELEPVCETACQAIHEKEIQDRAFKLGYNEGYFDGRNDKQNKNNCCCNCRRIY